jgi:hypothetical protein
VGRRGSHILQYMHAVKKNEKAKRAEQNLNVYSKANKFNYISFMVHRRGVREQRICKFVPLIKLQTRLMYIKKVETIARSSSNHDPSLV